MSILSLDYWFGKSDTKVAAKVETNIQAKVEVKTQTKANITAQTNINQELYLFHAQHNHNNRQGYYHFFNIADYLNDIWNSYNRSEVKLFHQLEIDFDRQGYFINDEECFNIQQLVNFLNGLANNLTTKDSTSKDYEMIGFDDICKNKQDNNKTINKYSIDDSRRIQINILNKELDVLIALLSTQASFAMPYEFLLKMFVNNNNDGKLLIQSRSKPPKIKFCLQDDDSIHFEMQLNCELIEIDCYSTNKKCADIYTSLTFQLGHQYQQLGTMSIIIKNVDNNINFD